MPCAPLLRFSDCPADSRAEAGEVMSGFLEVVGGSNLTPTSGPARKIQTSKSQRCFVRVYRTSSEHFAVLYPVRAIATACRPLASINLKSCIVKQLPNREIMVSPRSCEGTSVAFKGTESTNDAKIVEWVRAFSENKTDSTCLSRRKKVSDQRLPLPVLEESEEDFTD